MSFKETCKGKVQQTTFINYGDFERAMSEILGRDFEILESPNDSSHSTDVDPSYIEKYYDKEDEDDTFKKISKGHIECWDLGNLFSWLYKQGHVEAGKYVIEVSW